MTTGLVDVAGSIIDVPCDTVRTALLTLVCDMLASVGQQKEICKAAQGHDICPLLCLAMSAMQQPSVVVEQASKVPPLRRKKAKEGMLGAAPQRIKGTIDP